MKKRDLYIDVDGVILDTIPILDKIRIYHNVAEDDRERVLELFATLNWGQIINTAPEINEAFIRIQKIIDANLFNSNILTHFVSMYEIVEKIKLIRLKNQDISIIPVPKIVSKATIVCAKDAILIDDFSGNLLEWEDAGGIGIKFSQKEKLNCAYTVINELDAIIQIEKDYRQTKEKILDKNRYWRAR